VSVALSRHRLLSRECRESRKAYAPPVTAVLAPARAASEEGTTPLAPKAARKTAAREKGRREVMEVI
jgi:hypothetical protein